MTGIDFHTVQADGYGFQVEMAYRVLAAAVESSRSRSRSPTVLRRVEDVSRIVVEALVLVTWWAIRDRILRIRR